MISRRLLKLCFGAPFFLEIISAVCLEPVDVLRPCTRTRRHEALCSAAARSRQAHHMPPLPATRIFGTARMSPMRPSLACSSISLDRLAGSQVR